MGTEYCSLPLEMLFQIFSLEILLGVFLILVFWRISCPQPSLPSPTSPTGFCVFGNNSLSFVQCCPIAIHGDSMFHDSSVGVFLPLDLWKHRVMKENFSVIRPQIVENFIQRLMENYQDGGLEVCI